MVTKYDIFEFMYEKGVPIKPLEIVSALKSPDYHVIYQILLELERLKLVKKNQQGFQAIRSKKNDLLYQIIKFCIANNINYNSLLDVNITKFISKALQEKKFSIKDFKLNPRTFAKYIDILSRSGLLIVLSRKPLLATIPYNSFLRDLVGYFGYKVKAIKANGYTAEIEKELQRFKRLKRKNERKYRAITEKYEIRFIQHSLNLEGNPITLAETIKLIRGHIIPMDMKLETAEEVRNYQKAVEQMILDSAENKPLTKESILNYHYMAMQHKPNMAGKIRTIPVVIKNNPKFKIDKVNEIETKLNALLKEYNAFRKKKHRIREVLSFSAYFHNEFQQIHPFLDGNSRTTRLITFHLLRSAGVPIIDIPLGLLEEYLSSTKGAKKRDDNKLNQVLQRIILYNLKTINEQLQ